MDLQTLGAGSQVPPRGEEGVGVHTGTKGGLQGHPSGSRGGRPGVSGHRGGSWGCSLRWGHRRPPCERGRCRPRRCWGGAHLARQPRGEGHLGARGAEHGARPRCPAPGPQGQGTGFRGSGSPWTWWTVARARTSPPGRHPGASLGSRDRRPLGPPLGHPGRGGAAQPERGAGGSGAPAGLQLGLLCPRRSPPPASPPPRPGPSWRPPPPRVSGGAGGRAGGRVVTCARPWGRLVRRPGWDRVPLGPGSGSAAPERGREELGAECQRGGPGSRADP